MGRDLDVHPRAAVLPGLRHGTGQSHRRPRRAPAGDLRRLGDDGPHQPRGLDQAELTGRTLSDREGRVGRRLQQLRLASRHDEVMTRGTFANVRIKNLMVPGVEGGVTMHYPSGERMAIYDAAMQYATEEVPLIIMAGHEYGTGSSRDWAAKGTKLLGVRAVAAASFERIHRSNLVGMGVLPLQFADGTNAQTLGLDGTETFDVVGIEGVLRPRQQATLRIHRQDGAIQSVSVTVRIDTPIEVDYYEHGGILPFVLRQLMTA